MVKKKDTSENSTDSSMIQIMTISLFIILLAFFILLNAIAVVDEKKKKSVVNSIVESFGGESPVQATTGNYSENIFTDGVSPVEFQDLVAGNDKKLKDISVKGTRKKTTLSIPDGIIFPMNGFTFKRSGLPFLKKLIKVIKENKFPVDITCHLDDIPIFDKTGMTSRELTAIRSIRILRYMIEAGKIPPTQLAAFGWGSEKPQVSNKTVKSRKMNRRIDITFVHDRSKSGKTGFFIFKDFFFNVDK